MWRGAMLLLVPGIALAQQASVRMLGETWTTADGLRRVAKISIAIERQGGPSPALFRSLALNTRDFPLEKGPYPREVLATEQGGTVGVKLTISDSGVPTACNIARPSGVVSLDAHTCPHILRYARFYPALTSEGRRAGGQVEATVIYSVVPWVPRIHPNGMPPPPIRMGKPASPLTSPDLAMSAALKGRALPQWIGSVGAILRVETDGGVSACALHRPTQIDDIDKALCDNLMPLRFTPAIDGSGQPVAAEYFVSAFAR